MDQTGSKSVEGDRVETVRMQVLNQEQQAAVASSLRIAAQRFSDNAETVNQVVGKYLRSPNLGGYQDEVIGHYRRIRDLFVRQSAALRTLAMQFDRAPAVTLGAAALSAGGPIPAAHNGIEGELLSEGIPPGGAMTGGPTQSEASAARVPLDRVA